MQLGIIKQFVTMKEFENACRKHITQYFNECLQKNRLIPKSGEIIYVKSRTQFERMEEIIASARIELFVLGINLEGILNMMDQVLFKAHSGLKVHLLALDPLGRSLEFFNINNIDTTYRKNKIISNLQILHMKFASCKNIELKVIDRVFTAGCTAVDISTKNGRIIAQQYLNNVGTADAPILDLYTEQTPSNFVVYTRYLESLWAESTEYNSSLQRKDA